MIKVEYAHRKMADRWNCLTGGYIENVKHSCVLQFAFGVFDIKLTNYFLLFKWKNRQKRNLQEVNGKRCANSVSERTAGLWHEFHIVPVSTHHLRLNSVSPATAETRVSPLGKA
jgi:hypothetical protein